jgi:hypothetical protein
MNATDYKVEPKYCELCGAQFFRSSEPMAAAVAKYCHRCSPKLPRIALAPGKNPRPGGIQ